MTDAVPAAAVTAAENTLRGFLEPWHGASVHGTTLESQIHAAACIAVRDAAPLIAAAERERIRQLATDCGAVYVTLNEEGYACDALFVGLLTEGETT